ncbi:hypothetical protein FISHEDRAFT_69100 [Fistulina hepatica ATCC 64428]|uniref:Uncharacterized protein n=1 Tax=Fistulina hepatica ATCC 64428 TaxID=1128425 RepID=A0A0D7APL3_9AGAR|nr:hypothetical protein FISHEDRAFT_69100 [Fistulina hepatica ATCC 64428]
MSSPQNGHAKRALSINLPTEMLAEIFITGISLLDIEESEAGFGETFMNPDAIPMSVSQVCCRWRRIALSTPFLWSKIRLGSRQRHVPMEAIMTWLERSRNHPLDVEHTYHGSKKSAAFLELITLHCERLRSLRIVAQFKDSWVRLLKPIRGRLPLLSSLTVSSPATKCDLFEDTPCLTYAELIPFRYSRGVHVNLALPWAQLTHYQGNACNESLGMNSVLPHLPNVKCAWVCRDAPSSIEPNTPFVVLQHLVELHISASPLENILDAISAPNLRILNVAVRPGEVETATKIRSVDNFVRRSSCTLNDLSLIVSHKETDVIDPGASIIEVLRLCSSVETFELDVRKYSRTLRGVISALAQVDEGIGAVLLPKLRGFQFYHRLCPDWVAKDTALALVFMLYVRHALSVAKALPVLEDVSITMPIGPPAGTCADMWRVVSETRPSMVWRAEPIQFWEARLFNEPAMIPIHILSDDSDGWSGSEDNGDGN